MGKNNRGRGSPRGAPGGGGRGGRGGARGRGRGGGGFRGRGRGGPPVTMTGAQQGGYHTLAEMDEVYLIAEDHSYRPPSATSTPGRGRGSRGARGSLPGTPSRGGYGFRGRGRGLIDDLFSPSPYSKRGHGGIGDRSPRGRGGFSKGIERLRSDATLSDLLHQERPLLRPVEFVRSTLTATLFEEEEEIFRAGVEEIGDGEQSHQPTADRVFRLFSGTNHIPPLPNIISEDDSEAEVEEQLEEIDFNETEKLLDPTTALAGSVGNNDVEIIEERFTGIYINRGLLPSREVVKEEEEAIVVDEEERTTVATSTVVIESPQEEPMNVDLPATSSTSPPAPAPVPARQEEQPLFYIDTTPTSITDLPPPPIVPSDDEEIVYVAPHPRGEKATPARRPSPSFASSVSNSLRRVEETVFQTTSVLTGTTITAASTSIPPSVTTTTTATPAAIPAPAPAPPTTSSLTLSFPTSTPSRPRQIPAFSAGGKTKAAVKQRQRDKRAERRRAEKAELAGGRGGFGKGGKGRGGGMGMGMRGGLVEEARLRGENGRDKRWEERRRGDSDVDWGTDDEPLPTHFPSSSHLNLHPNHEDDLAGEAEGMLVDPSISLDAMKAFVKSMGVEGGREVSMDDVGDEEMLRAEDSASNGAEGSSAEEDAGSDDGDEDIGKGGGEEGGEEEEKGEESGEEDFDRAVEAEEELMIAEELILELPPDSGEDEEMDEEDEVSDDDDELDEGEVEVGGLAELGEEDDEEEEEGDDDDEDEDIDLSPGASFQARLERLRAQSRKTPSKAGLISNGKGKGKGKARMEVVNDSSDDEDGEDGEDEEDDDDEYRNNLSWAERDEEFIVHIQDIIDENEAVLTGRDRKARKQLFTAIRNGDFDDLDGFKPARKKKDKYKDLPPSLVSQWEKDRAKKAEYKKARELAKLEAAADPLVKKKGGKKGRKTMAALRSLSPSLIVLPNRIIDLSSLVLQIRRFISNLSGPTSMPLPPTNKETRKAIHELATAFGLNSKSEGKGEGRYTVLKKTSRCGEGRVDERKVGRIVRRFEGKGGGEFLSGAEWKEKNKVGKHREGDEVGKHAPKIGEANMGFQLLSRMGWSEGDRIGVTGGLEAPITALFKTSKLGLGATR